MARSRRLFIAILAALAAACTGADEAPRRAAAGPAATLTPVRVVAPPTPEPAASVATEETAPPAPEPAASPPAERSAPRPSSRAAAPPPSRRPARHPIRQPWITGGTASLPAVKPAPAPDGDEPTRFILRGGPRWNGARVGLGRVRGKMIALDSTEPLLARFPAELEAQAPPLSLRPDLSAVTAEDVAAARLAWATRIVDEYRSVVVFSELLTLLARLEMPYAALCAVQRLIGDELRHTRLCAEVVDWLGGMDGLEIDLRELAIPPTDHTTAGRALAIVARELTVAESESVRILRAYRDATSDPAIREVLARLLRDEVRHAAVGPLLEGALRAHLPPSAFGGLLAELEEIQAVDRRELRALYRSIAVGGPGRALGASITARDVAPCWP